MAEKRYFWLKMKEDYLNNPKIKKLRKIAGGDTYTIIYLKMQLLSVSNQGIIQFESIEPTFAEELALKLDEDVENVEITLTFLQQQGLIECNNNEFLLVEASNNIGSECSSAERVRLFREKRNNLLQCNAGVTQVKQNSISISNSLSNSNIEKEKINKRERFVPPTLEQITEYAKSKGRGDLASKFLEYYTVANWVDSKGNKVRNWKQKFLTWCGRDNMGLKLEQSFSGKDESILHEREYSKEDMDSLIVDIDKIEI